MSDVTDIVREIAEKVGTTAEKAWPLYVQYLRAEAISQVVAGAVVAALAFLMAKWVWRVSSEAEDTSREMARCLSCGVAGVVILVSVLVAISTLPQIICPDGAAICDVVSKAAK